MDLRNPQLVGLADVTYAQYAAEIRDPIRRHLLRDESRPAAIKCILLMHGLPHRIDDMNQPGIGDRPRRAAQAFLEQGNATYASVDSELTLLWLPLERGEHGHALDSLADNAIANPQHGALTGIEQVWRGHITAAKVLDKAHGVAWLSDAAGSYAVTRGDMYLVSRIDGATAADAIGLIRRAQGLVVNRARTVIVLDENDAELPDTAQANKELDDDSLVDPGESAGLFVARDDYEAARDLLIADGWQVEYDDTALFLGASDVRRPVIALGTYGTNHAQDGSEAPPGGAEFVREYALARGAIYNTIESFNGRALNGLEGLFGQSQAADFVAVGGTFGIGHVYEPFSFAVPDNEYLLFNFLVNRLSWAEAAWSAIPVLSWQHVVLGDPLGRVEAVVDWLSDVNGDGKIDLLDFAQFQVCFSGAGELVGPECSAADLDGDRDVDLIDFALFSFEFSEANP